LVIVDSGPLVAVVDRQEPRHAWAVARLRELPTPLLVCEPVITEVLYLLRRFPAMQHRVLDHIQADTLRIAFSLATEIEPVRALLQKYADVPMSLADACLVRMSELHRRHSIWTLDADFHIYRRHGREPIPLILPPEASPPA
jgi:predicted nucleic acid-binding protein